VRLARFDGANTGIVVGDGDDLRVVDVHRSLDRFGRQDAAAASLLEVYFPGPAVDWEPAIGAWSRVGEALDGLAGAVASGNGEWPVRPASEVRFAPPLPSRHTRIFAAGANFADHTAAGLSRIRGETVTADDIREEKERDGLPPWGFHVLPDLVVGHEDDVSAPAGTEMFDYEGEVAVVLGRGGRDMKPEDFEAWAIGPWNDLSIRDPHFGIGPAIDRGVLMWVLQKNFETGNAFGPWIEVDEGIDLGDIDIRTTVNDEVRQDGTTQNLIYSFGELAEHLSRYITLRAGDIITSGTPLGTAIEAGNRDAFLKPGDVVQVSIEGVGTLTNRVVA
jgi:2-keto-4-pentenoate hydratase/2-oxohepta-3-ene-1,7-dioic acid hydratase in catechol pathway